VSKAKQQEGPVVPDLLPCPFCASHQVATLAVVSGVWVYCRTCKASGPCKMSAYAAGLAWNMGVKRPHGDHA